MLVYRKNNSTIEYFSDKTWVVSVFSENCNSRLLENPHFDRNLIEITKEEVALLIRKVKRVLFVEGFLGVMAIFTR